MDEYLSDVLGARLRCGFLLVVNVGHSGRKLGGTFLDLRAIKGWPDWAIYRTLGNFSKPFPKINLPKSPTFLGNLCKVSKSKKFYGVKSFLANFYRHLGTYYWSHWIGFLVRLTSWYNFQLTDFKHHNYYVDSLLRNRPTLFTGIFQSSAWSKENKVI